MKTAEFVTAVTLVAASTLAGTAHAGAPARAAAERRELVEERTVFVTGSLIPQRIKLRRIGTATTSPVRIIDRSEIDETGRRTTAGAFVNEPAVRIIGR